MQKFNLPDMYDACTWVGQWPFFPIRNNNFTSLKTKLTECGIKRALVSPLDAVFAPDPLASFHILSEADRSFFEPVPIVDPSRANWAEAIKVAESLGIRVIKLLPNYHLYRLIDVIQPLVTETLKRGIVISIQIRMQDPRGRYPLLKVDDTDIKDVKLAVEGFPEQKFLLNGMYFGEVNGLSGFRNIRIGTEALEVCDIYSVLFERYSPERFVFSTHAPMFFPEGNLYKLAYAGISDEQKKAVGHDQLKGFIG